jgi:hypothetical protein
MMFIIRPVNIIDIKGDRATDKPLFSRLNLEERTEVLSELRIKPGQVTRGFQDSQVERGHMKDQSPG